MLWMLAREVRRMRGQDLRTQPWEVMMDLFLVRDQTEENQEGAEGEAQETAFEQVAADAGKWRFVQVKRFDLNDMLIT